MPLLALPSEILILIFDHIPHSCFRQDPSILYISKAWYTYAHAAFLQRLHLTFKSLPRFPPEDDEKLCDFIQDHTTALSLRLYGAIDYRTPIRAQLDQFADTVARLRKLTKFGFMACYCSTPWEAAYDVDIDEEEEEEDRFPLDYLMVESIRTLMLSLPYTVTTLKLDTIGSALMAAGRPTARVDFRQERAWHICKMFARLAALRVLKVRMDTACGDVFQGPHIRKITVNLRSRDKNGKKLNRVFTGCDDQRPGAAAEGSLEQRLFRAGREAALSGTVGTTRKECVILGEQAKGKLYEIDCGTGIVKNYSDKDGRAWGIRTDDYDYVVERFY